LFSYLVLKHSRGDLVLSWQLKPITKINHEIGLCYQNPLGQEWMSSHDKPSPAQVLEDGIPLGPGNSLHDDIRRIGKGRFSFWHNYLYFSASNNSDPRINGKKYEIRWPTPIKRSLAISLYAFTFLATLLAIIFSVQAIRVRLKNIEPDANIISRLYLLLKQRDEFAVSIFVLAATLGVALLFYRVYLILYMPVQTLAGTERLFIYSTVFFIFGFIGFYLARLFSSRQRIKLEILLRGVILIGTVYFLLLKPDAEGADIIPRIPYWGSITAIVGAFCFYIYTKFKVQFTFSSLSLFWKRWGLLIIILISIIIVLPHLVKIVIMWWDMSGWMDSRMYDNSAHDIATWQNPQGNSFVMPLYQYAMAFFYYIFGHFFYIQQVVNMLMGIVTIVLLSLTAWNLFRNKWAVFLIGILSAFTSQLYHAVHYTQIENWYIPLICLTIFIWSCYWRMPTLAHLVLLGVSTGLAFNCRLQGAFYFALLCLAPFFIDAMPIKRRFIHSIIAASLVGLSLLPWSIRNYIYEHRFSPASDQVSVAAVANDHRLVFYGIRQDLYFWRDILNEYTEKYPDKQERFKALQRDHFKNTFGDPAWLARAVFWRSLAFYNILPPGVFNPEGPKPTDWHMHWFEYVKNGLSCSLFFIGISLIGFIIRFGRLTLFLMLAVLSNLVITAYAPPLELRYSYPVIPFHMLLGMFVFFKPSPREVEGDWSVNSLLFSGNKKLYAINILLGVIIFFTFCHISVGRNNINHPLIEKAIIINPEITIDQNLPYLNRYFEWIEDKKGLPPTFTVGEKVRLRCKVTNYMLPPKWVNGVSYLPAFATDHQKEGFYYAYPRGESNIIGITYFGSSVNTTIRENDLVEVEGTIIYVDTENKILQALYWVKAEKIIKIKSVI
jgi:4-amino-4-deoxy-L-arabinose transferase-like glycosyltransferase